MMLCRVAVGRHLSLVLPVESPGNEGAPEEIDVVEELTTLAALHAVGLLAQDEYEAEKAELRARLLTT